MFSLSKIFNKSNVHSVDEMDTIKGRFEFIETEHNIVFDTINTLYNVDTLDGLTNWRGVFISSLGYHFASEEKFLKDCGYPFIDEHVKEHRELMRTVKGIVDTKLENENIECLNKDTFKKVDLLLNEILERHFYITDSGYMFYIQSEDINKK